MATQEFYIRNESDTEARGPFTLEQLTSLIDSGQLTAATLYYDTTKEEWTAIESNAELKASLFPEKKKLSIRQRHNPPALDQSQDSRPPITVDDMLAAAEGRTADTKDKQDPIESMARAAAIGRWAAIATLLLAAAGEVLPSTEVILAFDPAKLVAHPFVILGAFDLLLAVVLALGVVSVYPLVRFRAALGLGFAGFIFWTHGQFGLVVILLAGCLGLYLCTAFVRYITVAIAAALGLGGFALLSWRLLS